MNTLTIFNGAKLMIVDECIIRMTCPALVKREGGLITVSAKFEAQSVELIASTKRTGTFVGYMHIETGCMLLPNGNWYSRNRSEITLVWRIERISKYGTIEDAQIIFINQKQLDEIKTARVKAALMSGCDGEYSVAVAISS